MRIPDRCELWGDSNGGIQQETGWKATAKGVLRRFNDTEILIWRNKPDFTKTRSTVCHFRQRNYIYWDFQATKRFMFHLLAKRVIFSARNEWKVAGSWEMPCMSPVLWMVGKSWFVMVYPCLSRYNPIRIYSIVTYSYQLVVQACPQYVLASPVLHRLQAFKKAREVLKTASDSTSAASSSFLNKTRDTRQKRGGARHGKNGGRLDIMW